MKQIIRLTAQSPTKEGAEGRTFVR
jgi:hypothetical protein